MFEKKHIKNILWIVPALVALLIALIPTLKFQWPLTIDIFYHIHIAQVYSQYGLTLTDPSIDPGTGHKIGYPPLFSLLIGFLGKFLNLDYFQVAKLLQPLLAFLTVLSLSYVAKKFYGDIAGISAGFLIISSYLFSRLVSPLPETMALIFAPLVIYFYYKSVLDKNYLYALISGIMFILVVLTHQATILILFLVITAVTLVLGFLRRDIRFFTSYAFFLLIPVAVGGLVMIALFLMAPVFMQSLLTNFSTVTGYTSSLTINDPISNLKYISYLGIVLIFATIGGVFALKKRRDQDILVIVWIITIFLLSKAYWFGINVFSDRLLVHLLLPISILGGLGVSYLYYDFKKIEFLSKKVRSGFLITTFLVASLFGVILVEDPNFGSLPKYNTFFKDSLKNPQVSPPTESDIDLANWFNKNGNKKSLIVSNNYYTDQFLLATTKQPIASLISSEHVIEWGFKKSEFASKNVGYFVFDKRLTFSAENNTKYISGGAIIFLNNNTYNPKNTLQNSTVIAYENKDYIIFRINR